MVFAAFRDGVQRCSLSGVFEESRLVLLPFLDGVQQLSLLWGSQKRRQKSKPSVSMTLARSQVAKRFWSYIQHRRVDCD